MTAGKSQFANDPLLFHLKQSEVPAMQPDHVDPWHGL